MANSIPQVRVARAVNEEVIAFERALLDRTRTRPYEKETTHPVQINFFQSTAWLEHAGKDFRIIQLFGEDGLPAAQAAALISRPKRAPWFTHATVPAFGCSAINHDAEYWLLTNLPRILRESDNVMKVRLQAYRDEYHDLADFHSIARRAGFHLTDSTTPSRTVLIDLDGSPDEILARMNQKTRYSIRSVPKVPFEVRVLDQPRWVPQMQEALDASISRTGGKKGVFDFEGLFKVVQRHPDRARMWGLFLKSDPDRLMAYLVAIRHGRTAEAISSGSLSDPQLRKVSYAYILHWEAILWAREQGAKALDLSGITDGGSTDPLAGISAFKRSLSRRESDVGREMEIVVDPLRYGLYGLLKKLAGLRPKPISADG